MVKILAFSGSSRKDSFNQKLVAIAANGAQTAGAEVTLINLADFPMPIYNHDIEASDDLPETAHAFKQLLIASPEYNCAFSPLLKNAIDWASRAETDDNLPCMLTAEKSHQLWQHHPVGWAV